MLYWGLLQKPVQITRFWLKSGKNINHFTLRLSTFCLCRYEWNGIRLLRQTGLTDMKRKLHDFMLYVQCICVFICLYPTSKCYSVLSTHVFETCRFRISTGTRAILIKIFHSISQGIFWNNSSITSRQIPSTTIPFLVSLTGPTFDAV